jgi:hypothetical protein
LGKLPLDPRQCRPVEHIIAAAAVISDCGNYRYVLHRQLGCGNKTVTFIMLNPSTADGSNDDPTIRRCIGFANRWQCGKLVVLNLFGFRATDPSNLKKAIDPVGPDNKRWFERILGNRSGVDRGTVVCGWGVHGEYRGQDAVVLRWLEGLRVKALTLGATKDRHPRHPLYTPYSAALVPKSLRRR